MHLRIGPSFTAGLFFLAISTRMDEYYFLT